VRPIDADIVSVGLVDTDTGGSTRLAHLPHSADAD
jgi:hypothetical protein